MNKKVLKQINGKWKYQQTIYNLQKNITNYYKNNIELNTNLDEIDLINTKYYISHGTRNFHSYFEILKSNNLSKTTINEDCIDKKLYICTQNTEKILKYKYKKNNILYDEALYFINSKFFLSTILIKNKNKYIAIAFTSYIQIS